MEVFSLYKLFYKNKEEHTKIYEERFHSKDAVHLNISINENPAFFVTTPQLYRLLVSIMRYDKKAERLYQALPGVAIKQFTNRCLIDEIMQTNDIEGVHSTRKEIGNIILNLVSSDKRSRFVGLVNKYCVLTQNTKIPFNSCSDIRAIYDDIFGEEIKSSNPENIPDGKFFRKGSVSVYSKTEKELHRGLFPESKIIEVMDGSLKILNAPEIEPLFRVAIFHYLFGYIHPFYDGNGRTSRFISSYLLAEELNSLIAYRLSYTIKDNIKTYYDAFKICNDPHNKGDLTPFIEVFLRIVEQSERHLCEALQKRYEKLNFYDAVIPKLPNGKQEQIGKLYFYLIQASLFSNDGISIKELEECMELSYNSLKNRLALIPSELLTINRVGRNKYYQLNLREVDKMIQ